MEEIGKVGGKRERQERGKGTGVFFNVIFHLSANVKMYTPAFVYVVYAVYR